MLISSANTLDILSTLAPRAWCKKVLMDLIKSDQLEIYFGKGKFSQFYKNNEEINKNYLNDGNQNNSDDPMKIDIYEWNNPEIFHDIGVFEISEYFDWESGELKTFRIIWDEIDENKFPDLSIYISENSEYFIYELSGLKFNLDQIEMLAPNTNMPKPEIISPQPAKDNSKRSGGRPPKHDWNSFWMEVVCIADIDGLPGDDHGEGWRVQEDLVRRMSDWFSKRSSHPPGMNQIRDELGKLWKYRKSQA